MIGNSECITRLKIYNEVALEYKRDDLGEWIRLTHPMPKKQLFEIIKFFDLGSYMYMESTNPIINN